MFNCLCGSTPKDSRVLVVKGGLKVETIPLPTAIHDNEVLVKVTHSSLNIRDGIKLAGPEDRALSSDFAGVVKKVGSDSGFKRGELVYGTIEEGALAEYLIVSNESISRTPDKITSDVACCLPFAGWVAYQIFEKKKKDFSSIVQNNLVLKVIIDAIRKNKAQSTEVAYDDDDASSQGDEKGEQKSGISLSRQNIMSMLEISELAEKLKYAKSKGSFAKVGKWISDNKMWFKDIYLPKESFVASPEKLKIVRKEFLKLKVGPYVVPIDGDLFTKFEAYMIIEKKGLIKENGNVSAEAIDELDITRNYVDGGKKNLNATQYTILSLASNNTSNVKRSANSGRVYGPRPNSKNELSVSFRVDA